MELDSGLLRQFAALANGSKKDKESESTVYGTVVKNGGALYVRLDGSELLTPVSMAMDAESGDRVVVTIKNHTATVTGNITSPASARTATKFMKFTDADGLVVGDMSDEKLDNNVQVLSDAVNIRLKNLILASFSKKRIELGKNSSDAVIDLLNGLGSIYASISDEVPDAKSMTVYSSAPIDISSLGEIELMSKTDDNENLGFLRISTDGSHPEIRIQIRNKDTYNRLEMTPDNAYFEKSEYLTKEDLSFVENNTLWSGCYYMTSSHTINLSQAISLQKNGIVLVWQYYDSTNKEVKNWYYNHQFIPKSAVNYVHGAMTFILTGRKFDYVANKNLYIADTTLKGHDDNTAKGTVNGITFDNSKFVLTRVIGV